MRLGAVKNKQAGFKPGRVFLVLFAVSVLSLLLCFPKGFIHAETQQLDVGTSAEVPASPSPAPSPSPQSGGGGGGSGNNGGSAIVSLKGIAYPGSRVTVLRDGSQAAVTAADPGAHFSVQLTGLSAGNYNFSVYALDPDGRKSPTFTAALAVTDGVSLEINDIFLGPTIGLSHSEIKKGDTLNIFGFSAPNAQVNIMVHSAQMIMKQVTSNKAGAWFEPFDTSFLDLGSHSVKSKILAEDKISPFSEELGFKVGTESVAEPGRGGCKRSDLNCEGRVNLTDFSILLYFWQKKNPSNPRADINGDGVVNLTDLSIMLYDWTA